MCIDDVTVDEAGAATGTFHLYLYDTYGDGWNGGYISIIVAGETALDQVTVATGSEADFYFDVTDGDEVFCDYEEGGWPDENEYYVFNNIEQLVVSSGEGGEIPEDLTFTAEVAAAEYGALDGTVTSAERTPIEGAVVTIGTQSATTLADGTYLIEDVFIGTYDVECFAEGYFYGYATDVLIENGVTTTLDFALELLIGDTIEDPIYVVWEGTEYSDAGTSSIYNDDYSTGGNDNCPDVVYEFTIGFDTMVDVSLLESSFDTKLGIYEYGVVPGTDNYLYYNDDYWGRADIVDGQKTKDRDRVVQSALYDMELPAGTYVAVVDGYGSAGTNHGPYQIDMHFDPIPIYDIQYTEDPSGDSPYVGQIVTVTGILTATDSESKYYLQDDYGPWNGIYLYSWDLDPIPAVGDEITVTAEVQEYYGLTELLNVDDFVINSSGNDLPDAYIVGTGLLRNESLEGVLIAVEVATCTEEPDEFGAWKVDDGSGDLYVDDTFYAYDATLGNIYNVTGPLTYAYDFFRILPRNAGDIEDITNELLWPPVNLQYTIDESNINLTWTAPTQYGWNGYYQGPQYLAWATPERATLFDVTDFGFSYPIDISSISHGFYHHSSYPWGEDSTFVVKIYDADGITLLYESEEITALEQWDDTIIPIPPMTMTDNFWVAIAPDPTTGMPASLGHVSDTSHGYSGSPGDWGEDLEWATFVYMEGDPFRIAGTSGKKLSTGHKVKEINNAILLTGEIPEYIGSRALLGYNVFRDGVMLNTELVPGTAYTDSSLAAGTYTYYATAVWHMGESVPSNEVTVQLLYGDLDGYVTDAETTDPLEGATITAGTYATTSLADGYYIIEDMLVGTYDVGCSFVLYESQTVEDVEITDGGLTTVDFALIPEGGDIYFIDDFESGDGNWTFEGTWGLTEEDAHSPTHSMTESPDALYGADLNISSTLATPWDLSGFMNATLLFWYKSDIETAFDYMYLEITIDGTNWLNLATYDEEDGDWQEEEIALGGFVGPGNETVTIRFRFESDGGYETVGMLIDDLTVTTSMEDTSPPFIVHDGPEFYEGTPDDYEFTADIIDVSGIASADVVYTLDEGEEITLPFTSVTGNTYTFIIPAQDAGVQVDYKVIATDASENSNEGESSGFVYIAGSHLIYDNGVVDFYTTIAQGTGAAVKILNPAGFQLNLAYALIRNYTDQSGQDNDDMEIHIWADDGGIPGADLITPFMISPEATYENTSPMTRVDLRPYAAELANVQGDFYVGFISETGGEYGEVHCTTTSPGNFTNSFILTGTDWSLWDGTDLHFRAVAELIVTSTGTVTGFVTRSDTGDPLEGALVSVGTASETTADDGSYTIVADTGVQPVTCELEGYESFSGEVTVLEGEEVILDIELDPAFWPPINLDYTYNPPMPNVILQWDEPEPPARMMDITNNNTTITLGEKDPKAVKGQSLADTYSTVNENTRVLTGYTIYRNEEPIGTAVSTFYLDANVEDGEYEYWVTANYEDPTGESEQSNSVFVTVYAFSDDDIIPLVTKLSGNYPNPFNPTTEISFSLKKGEFVAIDIYNVKGEKVKTLVNDNLEAGYYIIIWDSTDNNNTSVTSGVYFYKMKAGRYTSTKKMILMK